MVIFQSPENFCGFLYFLMVGVGILFIVCLMIKVLIIKIFEVKSMNEYKELYKTNPDFRRYVDQYMRNKTVSLSEVLSLKIT